MGSNKIARLLTMQGSGAIGQPAKPALEHLRHLNLSNNHLCSWSDIREALADLPNLQRLYLNDNKISQVTVSSSRTTSFPALQHITLSGNAIERWSDLEALDDCVGRIAPAGQVAGSAVKPESGLHSLTLVLESRITSDVERASDPVESLTRDVGAQSVEVSLGQLAGMQGASAANEASWSSKTSDASTLSAPGFRFGRYTAG